MMHIVHMQSMYGWNNNMLYVYYVNVYDKLYELYLIALYLCSYNPILFLAWFPESKPPPIKVYIHMHTQTHTCTHCGYMSILQLV